MEQVLITGASGFTGTLLMRRWMVESDQHHANQVYCLVRPTSDLTNLRALSPKQGSDPKAAPLIYVTGDSSTQETWERILTQTPISTIIHIASIRHVPVMLRSLAQLEQTPRLIVVGTTGVYSQYNQYSAGYRDIEAQLSHYLGHCCLLRPTMIYGSDRDKNLHKLIRFCDRYGFFPIFGPGNCLLQPVHADDLAQAILSVFQSPSLTGAYDLSGGSVVRFQELLGLVGRLLGQSIYPVRIPFKIGVGLATVLEQVIGQRSPVRREQILRLQEDKAYSHEAARQDFGFSPRSLEVGLQQEVNLLRQRGVISKL